MTRLKSSKLNEFRLWGLLLTMIGMGIMIIGTAAIVLWGEPGKIIAYILLVVGILFMLGSIAVYFWAGMLATTAVTLPCPECGKTTRILGKTDRCMFCKTILTLDEKYAPKE